MIQCLANALVAWFLTSIGILSHTDITLHAHIITIQLKTHTTMHDI